MGSIDALLLTVHENSEKVSKDSYLRDSISQSARVKWDGGEKSSVADPVLGEAREGMAACVNWEWGDWKGQ